MKGIVVDEIFKRCLGWQIVLQVMDDVVFPKYSVHWFVCMG
jgi:hypothetical protein